MVEDGDSMTYSRVNKYRELREGLKDEAGIRRETVALKQEEDNEEDDFLSFMKKDDESFHQPTFDDTLTEAKTFEQMRQESSEEIDRALRSVKESVGKAQQYNTRMDILNKIREPEKQTIKIDSLEHYSTDQFSKGMFINQENDEVKEEENNEPQPKMTLMERLAAMSPKEDVEKAEAYIEKTKDSRHNEDEQEKEEIKEPIVDLANSHSLEDMIQTIKEKDRQEVEKALSQNDVIQKYDLTENEDEDIKAEKESKIVTILNVVIVILIIILIALFGMILYQSFF